jgi:tetratricopeptide (TPR) repeat protein
MGWAYYKKGDLDIAKKHFAEALPLWEKFLKSQDSNESNGETHFYMGIYSLMMGDMPGAKEHLNKVLAVCQNPVFTDLAKKELAKLPNADKK